MLLFTQSPSPVRHKRVKACKIKNNISNFHWKYFTFFPSPPFFYSLLFCKRFDCYIFQKKFFYIRDPIREVFKGKKKLPVRFARHYVSRLYFGLSGKISCLNSVIHESDMTSFEDDLVLVTKNLQTLIVSIKSNELTLKLPWVVLALVCYILGSGKCTLSDFHDAVVVTVWKFIGFDGLTIEHGRNARNM